MKQLAKAIFITIIFSVLTARAQSCDAKWITSATAKDSVNEWFGFKKTISLQKIPKKATIQIAADSKYWLYINDTQVVFEGGLKRGPNPKDTYYDTVDIAPYLREGDNTCYVQLWFFGKDGFSHKNSGKAGLFITSTSKQVPLCTDNTWQAAALTAYSSAPVPYPNFRLPESSIVYDAQKQGGIIWQPATEAGRPGAAPWNKLVKRPIPQWKNYGLLPYTNAQSGYERRGDTVFCKLPYNCQFTPYIKVDAPAGRRIVMVTDNYVHYNGSDTNLRAEYITKNGIQEHESLGWLNGHYMYYILPKDVKLLDVKYRETGYASEFAGDFSCSDDFLNRIWQKSRRTLYLTMRDNYMDCPDRERAQWTGDAVLEAEEAFYALDTASHALTRKWLRELLQWQRPDGSLYAPVPSGNWDVELPDQVLATIGYYGVWTYYMHTADKQLLKDVYPGVQRYLNLWKKRDDGLMELRNVGWVWGDWGENKDMLPLYNLWYYLALKGNYLMSKELGMDEAAGKNLDAMNELAVAFNSTFWNGTAYRDPKYTGLTDDRVQALAVVSGIADAAKYPALLQVFKTQENASPYMEKYVFEALYTMGYPTDANSRLTKRFGAMVNNTYFTTLFEGWDIGNKGFGGGTVNHAWSGGALTVLSGRLCGIRPLEPGYKKFIVAPQPGDVTSASATVQSVKGTIATGYKSEDNKLTLTLTVPRRTKAVAQLPQGYTITTVNGRRSKGKAWYKKGKWEITAERQP